MAFGKSIPGFSLIAVSLIELINSWKPNVGQPFLTSVAEEATVHDKVVEAGGANQ